MSREQVKPPHTWLGAMVSNKCPRCRVGKIYKSQNPYNWNKMTAMPAQCAVCGQPMELETWFYYGTGYVSYALTVAFIVSTFVAWWVLLGFSAYDNSIYTWLGSTIALLIVLQPLFMRLSRSLWLSAHVRYNPNWKNEKIELKPVNLVRDPV